jgi:hypothetical protein
MILNDLSIDYGKSAAAGLTLSPSATTTLHHPIPQSAAATAIEAATSPADFPSAVVIA